MEENNPLKAKQVDHLILLVGGNPLPNAVSGRVLLKPGGTIGLVYSAGTIEIKDRLKKWFGLPSNQILEKQIDESNGTSIYQGVTDLLRNAKTTSIGLNYTGGTKAMSVHAYQAIKDWATQKKTKPILSYLDARQLQFNFDAEKPEESQQPQHIPVGLSCPLQLEDLLALHGWSLNKGSALTTKSTLPQSAKALISVVQNPSANPVWRTWLKKLEEVARTDKGEWKNEELRKTPLAWPDQSTPEIAHFVKTFAQETGQSGTIQLDFGAPKDKGVFKKVKHVSEWLHGKWLEHYVLDVLTQLAENLQLHQSVQNVETEEVTFEVDVVALRGHQLFAMSCSTSSYKSLLKSKLFEAYIRARQIGGDEARVALICCLSTPNSLQQEMRQELDNSHIRVFGLKELSDLSSQLQTWIQTESRQR